MSKTTKKLMTLAGTAFLALGLLVLNANKAHAVYAGDSISSNNAAGMVVRITPNADRGVQISTGNVNMNLGTVDLSASTQTVDPATVTIQGNMTGCELELSASITGGWVFGQQLTRISTGTNQLGAWATFTSVSTTTAPGQDDEYFRVGTSSGAKLYAAGPTFAAQPVGVISGSSLGFFENNETAGDMDDMVAGNVRHLWTYFTLPPTTSITGQQRINFVLALRDQ